MSLIPDIPAGAGSCSEKKYCIAAFYKKCLTIYFADSLFFIQLLITNYLTMS